MNAMGADVELQEGFEGESAVIGGLGEDPAVFGHGEEIAPRLGIGYALGARHHSRRLL
jgi:hypothetical protein